MNLDRHSEALSKPVKTCISAIPFRDPTSDAHAYIYMTTEE